MATLGTVRTDTSRRLEHGPRVLVGNEFARTDQADATRVTDQSMVGQGV